MEGKWKQISDTIILLHQMVLSGEKTDGTATKMAEQAIVNLIDLNSTEQARSEVKPEVMPNEVVGGGLSKQKLELVRKDIIDCMKGLEKAPDTIWINPDAGISETIYERLWQMYLTLQGNEAELENIFESRREA